MQRGNHGRSLPWLAVFRARSFPPMLVLPAAPAPRRADAYAEEDEGLKRISQVGHYAYIFPHQISLLQ